MKPIAGELVAPEALAFETTFVGYPREAELTLSNRSRASRTLTVRITGPFSTLPEVVAAGGADTALPVTFSPIAAGDFTGTLTLSDEAETIEIALLGSGVQPPTCTSTACELSVFDAALGHCATAQLDDGTSCSNACVSGTCSSGRCVGTQVDCGDSNPCTVDACEPATGCVHPPMECAAPTNPCKTAHCDPFSGCVENDVRDGVACGEADCATSHVCIAGLCKTLPTPDGSPCGTASPCQGVGTCQQSVCVQPPGGPLHEAWSYEFPGPQLSFAGVNDSGQNLYWVECAFGGLGDTLCDACTLCATTSYTAAGTLRFRKVQVGIDHNAKIHHLLASDDTLVFASHTTLGAVSTADGTQRWELFLGLNPSGVGDLADEGVITALAATPTAITAVLSRTQAQQARKTVVFQFDVATGAVIFTKAWEGTVSAPVLDESGNITFKVSPWYTPNPPPPPSFLVSLTSTGVERWRVLSPAGQPWLLSAPAAAFQGELQLESGEVRALTDGGLLVAAPSGDLISNPLMNVAGRVLLRTPMSATQINAIGLQRGVEAPIWEVLVRELHGTNSLSETIATSTGGFLVAGGDSRHPTALKGFSASGAERFSCEIPWSEYGDMPVALLDRRWVVFEPRFMVAPKLHVYDVGAELPALHGWMGARGSPSGSQRPLP